MTHRFYEGEARPRDQIAVITTAKSYTGSQLMIKAVDGKEQPTLTYTAEVLSGYHAIHVHATRPEYLYVPGGYVASAFHQDQFDLTLHAIAGRTYRLEWGEGESRYPVFTDITDD